MKIVCISDTHDLHNQLQVPDGDMLIHAGDITSVGGDKAILDFNQWLGQLPHKYKIVIAGNHDYCFESEPVKYKSFLTNAIYLNNESVEIEHLKIWGSPHSPISPKFGDDGAFTMMPGQEMRKCWQAIPIDTDILITHCPPFGILDTNELGTNEGCKDLTDIVQNKIKPRLHIFGHIHWAYGQIQVSQTHYVNASAVDLQGWLVENRFISKLRRVAISLSFFRRANQIRQFLGISKEALHQKATPNKYMRAKNRPIVIEV